MPATPPVDITALPTPPDSGQPSSFNARADAFVAALPTFVAETNAAADNVYANAVVAEAAVTAAELAETNAESAAAAADVSRLLAVGAANYQGDWLVGTTYTVGQSVSHSGARYVAKQTTVGNTPPNATYWLALPSSGTVTSVGVSGGSTGLSFSGSPITDSGTITLSGTLDVDNGGTGQTTYTNGQLLIGNTTGNTLAKTTLTPGTGITITNGAGSITIAVTGSTYQPLDSDLTAVAGLSSNGVIVRTGSGTASVRTITAGTGVSVTNGDGVSGNPTVAADLASDADLQAATANKVIHAGILNTANAPEESTGSSAWAPNFNSARTFTRILTGNQAFDSPTNIVAGQSGIIFITQTGTAAYNVTGWDAKYKWPATGGAAPSLNTGQNKVNVVGYYCKSATEIVANFLGSY
jgi:hypothetical protein